MAMKINKLRKSIGKKGETPSTQPANNDIQIL